jgi:alpha-1,2-mannosyltransferase
VLTRVPWNGRAVVLGVGLAFVYLLTANYDVRSVDVSAAEVAAWHLGVHGTPWLDGISVGNPWLVPGAHGHTVSTRFPGTVLVGVPFYAVLGRAAGGPGYPPAPGAVAAAVVTALAVVALYLALRRAAPGFALGGALAMGLATPTWAVSAEGLWPHGPAQLCLALALLQLSRGRSPGWPLAAAVLVRPHLLILSGVLALAHLRHGGRRAAVQVMLVSSTGLLAYVAWNRWVYGRWTLLGQYLPAGMHRSGVLGGLPELPLALVSPGRGLLVLTPVLVLLCVELAPALRAEPWWSRAAAAGGALSFLVTVWLVPAGGGDGFYGYRFPLEPLVLAAPLLFRCWQLWCARGRWHQRAAVGLLALSAALSSVGAVLYRPGPAPEDAWTTLAALDLARSHGVVPVLGLMALSALATCGLIARQQAIRTR